MRTITTLLLTASLLAGCSQTPSKQTTPSGQVRLLVGTYTDGNSEGIYSFDYNPATAKVTPLDTLELKNPSFLNITPDGSLIYAVSETSDSLASLGAIAFDAVSGQMTLLNSERTNGEDPCYVESNGHVALTANYTGGSLSVLPLSANGQLQPVSQQVNGSLGGNFMPNQQTAHVHTTRFSPSGKWVLATDFSGDRILRLRVDANGMPVADGVAGSVSQGSGPRHIDFSPNGQHFYVMSELSGCVSAFAWDEANGKAQRIQEIASDSVGGHGGADIHLSADGRFLYASNRLKADGISIFAVDGTNGTLTKVGYQPTGAHPRNFALSPDGQFLLCACRDAGGIEIYRRNADTGLLSPTGQQIAIDKAVCVKFHVVK